MKRFLALLLAMTMVFGMVPFGALATEPAEVILEDVTAENHPEVMLADGDISSGTPDGTPPVLTGMTLSVTTVTAPGQIEVTVSATDDVSGVNGAVIDFICRETGKRLGTELCSTYWDSSLREQVPYPDGNLHGTIYIDQYVESGNFEIEYIHVSDMAGNGCYYHYNNSSNPIPDCVADMTFHVTESDTPDGEPPVLTGMSLTAATMTAPGQIEVTLSATDDVSGVNGAVIDFICRETGKRLGTELCSTYWDSSLREQIPYPDGNLHGTIYIDQYVESGNFEIEYIHVSDMAGNGCYYHYNNSSNPIPDCVADVTFNVLNAIPDVTTSVAKPEFVEQVKDAVDNAYIVADYSGEATMKEEVFEAIAGTDKTLDLVSEGITWRFNGEDITEEIKPIDLNVQITKAEEETSSSGQEIQNKLDETPAVVMKFAENGQLPGKATIQVKVDYAMREYLGSDKKLCVYYYNNQTGELELVAENLTVLNDTYVEFTITHCSYYILTTKITPKNTWGDNVFWVLSSDGVLTISGTGPMTAEEPSPWAGNSDIKRVVIREGITTVGDNVFSGCSELTSVEFPSSLQRIGNCAFMGAGLTSVVIPEGVTKIDACAFLGCMNMESAVIPTTVETIGPQAFSNIGLRELVIPEGVTTVYSTAFAACNDLTYVSLPSTLTSIDMADFRGVKKLSVIQISEANPVYSSDGGCLVFNKNRTELILASAALSGVCTLPAGLTSIANNALSGCSQMTEIHIPATLQTVGNRAFYNCSSLKDVYYGGRDENWYGISIGYGNDYLTSANRHSRPAPVASGSCGDNLIWELDADGTLTISGTGPMYGRFQNSHNWFNHRESVRNVVIQEGVTTIGDGMFDMHPNMVSITLPESLTTIGYTFSQCPQLGGIYIPKNVTDISPYCFYQCTSLRKIEVDPANTVYSSDSYGVLLDKQQTTIIKAPGGFQGAYVMPDTVVTVGRSAFEYCSGLTSVEFSSNLRTIGMTAFMETSITEAKLPEGLETLEVGAFAYCYNLVDLTLPTTLREIQMTAFWAVGIREVIIPEGVTTIGAQAFENCMNLVTVSIPSTVTSIGTSPFSYCYQLKQINVSEENQNYSSDGKYMLFNKDKTVLHFVSQAISGQCVLPQGLTTIDAAALHYCERMTEIHIPATLQTVGNSAFSGCYGLSDVFYDGNEAKWNEITIEMDNDCLLQANRKYAYMASGVCGENLTWTLDYSGVLRISGTGPMYNYPAPGNNFLWIDDYKGEVRTAIIEEGVTTLGNNVFQCCYAMTSISLPSTLQAIGNEVFYDCLALKEITIPAGVTSIGTQNFYRCEKLTAIHVDPQNEHFSVGGFAVLFNKDQTLLISASSALSGPYEIPATVTEIASFAFDDWSQLQTIHIPTSVVNIRDSAFYMCPSLKDVYYEGIQMQWNSINIEANNESLTNATIHFAPSSGTGSDGMDWNLDHQGTLTITGTGVLKDNPWENLKDAIENVVIGDGITGIGEGVFKDCTDLKDITFPDSLTDIDIGAFEGCTGLTDVELPEGLISLGDYAFYGCSNLIAIGLPSNIAAIGNYTFYGCSSLLAMKLPASIAAIGIYALYGCTSMTEIEIPVAVTTIGDFAFNGCSGLKTVYYPGSRTQWAEIAIGTGNEPLTGAKIRYTWELEESVGSSCGANLLWVLDDAGTLTISGTGAMYQFSLTGAPWYSLRSKITRVVIEPGVTTIGGGAFAYCSGLTEVSIPDTVTSIGSQAFYSSALHEIYIHAGITSIGQKAFSACDSLSFIRVDINNPKYCNDDVGALFTKDMKTLCAFPGGIRGDYVIPDSTTFIGSYAFYFSNIGTVTVPASVTKISSGAFANSDKLTAITLPDTLISIGDQAFSGCSALQSVTIPETVTSIGAYAFSNCRTLPTIRIPAAVVTIGTQAFKECNALDGIWVAEDNTNYCNDEFGVLHDKEKTCLIAAPGTLTDSYTIADTVTAVLDYAFYECKNLGEIVIGSNVLTIGQYSFAYCEGLPDVRLPATITTIGNRAFFGCTKLAGYWVDENNPTFCNDSFGVLYNKDSTRLIAAPSGLSGSYAVPEGVTVIGDDSFYACTKLTGIQFPSTLTTIEDWAFSGCTKLAELDFPDSLTDIGTYAFNDCESLIRLVLPAKLSYVGSQAFSSCGKLRCVIFPDSLTDIASSAFSYCSNLACVQIPVSLTDVDRSAFRSCTKLTDVYYLGTEAQWLEMDVRTFNEPLLDATIHYETAVCAAGHTEETIPGVDATCTATGLTEGKKCAVCQLVLTKQEAIESKSHTEAVPVTENEVAAGCETAGSYDSVVYCAACGEELTRTTAVVDATGHSYGAWTETKTSTCTEKGEEQRVCKHDASHIEIRETVLAKHIYGTVWEMDEWTHWHECVCGAKNDETDHWDGPVQDHKCDTCGYTMSKCMDSDDADHMCNWCGNDGVTDHAYGPWATTKVATCAETGSREKSCACGDTVIETIVALGHDLIDVEGKAATCTEEGYTAYKDCTRCDYIEGKNVVPATGHSHGQWKVVKEATCIAEGSKEKVCACGDVVTEMIAALSHDLADVAGKSATCTEAGYTAYKDCTRCDYIEGKKVIPAIGHIYGSIVTAPTCTQKGYTTYTCVCGDTYTVDGAAALGHSWIDATYDAPKTCPVCSATEGDKLIRPTQTVKPDHVQTEGDNLSETEKKDIIDIIVDIIGAVAKPDHGIDSKENESVVENAKDHIKDENGKPIHADKYATSLTITLQKVTVDKNGDAVVADKITYDVTPWLYALNDNNEILGQAELNNFKEALTFRLPVDKHTDAKYAHVWHEDVELELHLIITDEEGNKYVEVKSKTFSAMSVQPHEHHYESVETGASCITGGYTTFTCSCGDSYRADEVQALGHLFAYTVKMAPTLQADGKLEGVCKRCDKKTEVVLPKLNEEDYEYQVITEPTEQEDGLAQYTYKNAEYGTFCFVVTLDKLVVVLLGDVNDDGVVTVLDLMRLANCFAGKDVEINAANADVNNDGVISVLDLMRLANYFAGKASLA